MRKNLLVLFTLLSFVLPSVAVGNDGGDKAKKAKKSVKISAEERKMAEAITAEQLKDYLTFISSDAMGGRDTPSPGLDITAHFIALNLKKWGFKPAGDDGTFFQKMTAVKQSVEAGEQMLKVGENDIMYSEDFFRVGGNGMVKDAPMVFGKDGWMVKAKGIDAFKGVDVKDKIVVMFSNENARRLTPPRPKGVSAADVKGEKGVDWADPMTNAKMNGAKGVIFIASPAIEGLWGRLKGFLTRGSMVIEGLPSGGGGGGGDMLPSVIINKKTAGVIFDGESSDHTSESAFDLKKTGSLSAMSKTEKIPTQNVVAIWEGDAKSSVKDEMVAIGAHYDHVGTNENAPGDDKIWNGADDDGSGTTGVLAIAEALSTAKKRPKRSILFVWHAGEEKGLLGAQYFNKYPTVDIKKVITQLNIDMIGRSMKPGEKVVKCGGPSPCNEELSGPNEVYVIGSEMMSSKLGEITKGTNESYMKMNYNYKYDDPKDTNRFFFRSDHFMYAQNGIPIAFWFTGTHLDYHQPGDEVEKIDFAKMEKIVRTIFLTMWELSELKERPVIDKELPKELKSR